MKNIILIISLFSTLISISSAKTSDSSNHNEDNEGTIICVFPDGQESETGVNREALYLSNYRKLKLGALIDNFLTDFKLRLVMYVRWMICSRPTFYFQLANILMFGFVTWFCQFVSKCPIELYKSLFDYVKLPGTKSILWCQNFIWRSYKICIK